MSVLLLDPRWPTLIPLPALAYLGGPVSYTGEVPISVRWDLGELLAKEGTGVLVSTDPENAEVQQRIDAGETVYRADSLQDSVADARRAMVRALEIGEWESTRTHENLLPYLHEESKEFEQAVERWGETGDEDALRDELADILLQVLFHAELAGRRGAFTLDDVAESLVNKLRRRAPYLFDGTEVMVSVEEQNRLWEAAKQTETEDS